ncbi:helix-turn-helix transcriptional regulator [Frankia sp. AgKG'84/4]
MTDRNADFGRELRRQRLAAGRTLTDLAAAVHYSKGHLSKIERGRKTPNRELAGLCDAALRTGGVLVALLSDTAAEPSWEMPVDRSDREWEVWHMQLSSAEGSWFKPMDRRELVAAGLASAIGSGIRQPITVGAESDTDAAPALEAFRELFDAYRKIGQSVAPGFLLPALIAQTYTLRELAVQAGSRQRPEILRLGSRYAEYVGWLTQESGDDSAALWWTRRAVDLAAAGGDESLAAYASVRHALVTLYRGKGDETVALARQARSAALPPRIRGLAAQREAQGHAINGDHASSLRCLDDARDLFAAAAVDDGAPVVGSTHLIDPASMITGWCLLDLGRPGEAADVLDRETARIPAHARRTQARYGTRRARAHATAGQIDHACALVRDLLPDLLTVSSATVIADLRQLARTLGRHPRNRSVQALGPELSVLLDGVHP